ncbi:uncharacterized protein LOC143017480 [Oratosquilla oratoria]|uniref:uncharacterized protein LOC143017480 n=1 Tax=Oratosquilla oratoria TaxID=337810 RepID=UPI003F773A2E
MGSAVRTTCNRRSNINIVSTESQNNDLSTLVKDLQGNQANIERQLLNITKVLNNLTYSNRYKHISTQSTYRCWFHESSTHDTQDCYVFKSLSDKERLEIVKSNNLCFNCLSNQHRARNCTRRETCDVIFNNKKCGMWHHPLLHRSPLNGTMYHVNDHKTSKVLLMVSSIYHNGVPINTMWDSGSDVTVITHSMAKRLGLIGKDVQMTITKVGNVVESCMSKEYTIPLVDQQGKIWKIKAYGLDEITSNVYEVDANELSRILQVNPMLLVRPVGKVDMLIGSDCCQLLPKVIKTVGSLQLLENQFGYCVRGSMGTGTKRRGDSACVRVNHILFDVSTRKIEVSKLPDLKVSLDNVFGNDTDYDDIPCFCRRSIPDEWTLKETRELKLIEQGLTFDEVNRVWVVKYPWIKNPANLPNNCASAVARMKATEKRLLSRGSEHCKLYQNQIDEMIAGGIARKITRAERVSYTGPVHYIHHHEVMKPNSQSTPMRIVFDSSASYRGHQLNAYWAKGPDILNSLLGVLLRMRQEKVVVMGDISRMYHTIRLDEKDQHTHRFIWRDFNVLEFPEHYIMTRVTFGDRPSGIIATLALRHTAEKYASEYPAAAKMIMRNTYVDDMVQSVNSEEKATELIKEAEHILASGGFVVKHWVTSANNHNFAGIKLLETETEKVLGMSWDIKSDQFYYSVRINFSPKQNKIHSRPNLLNEELESKFPQDLTRRMVLSQIASVFDPLGLVQPFLLSAKLLMREMIMDSKNEGWDDPMVQEYRRRWLHFFKELYNLENLRIERSIRPENATGNPILILFSDGSRLAYGAVAYCRFFTQLGEYRSSIIMAKSRMAPAKQTSIPRIELCAAVLSCRLRMKIEQELEWHFERVIHIVDSEIVRAQIQKDSHKFKSFVGTRIAEIQSKSDPKEWWWTTSKHNPADMLTRSTEIKFLTGESTWQKGPEFLKLPLESWPISQTDKTDLPDRIDEGENNKCTSIINNVTHGGLSQPNLTTIIQLQRFSSYVKLLRVTSRVLASIRSKSFRAIGNHVNSSDMQVAEKLWVREVQKEFSKNWQTRFSRLGPTINNEGIIIVGSRMKHWLKQNWNSEVYMLLPPTNRFTYLYLSHLHGIDHSGVDTTISKLQRKFWVPGARRIVKSLKNKCVICKKLSHKVEGQKMGELVEERLRPSPPFCHTACDMFGPFKIRDAVKRRTFGKAFGIIFNCMSTRSVYIDLVDGYDTQSLLLTFRRFVSIRGYPCSMYSDRGPQLVSASKELKQVFNQFDWNDVCKFGRDEGMEWQFTKSADAPWQNGVSEALIRSVKRSLKVMIGENTLTFGELQTVFFEVANLLNERPIGIKRGSDVNAGCYICPNELLLGRASNHAPVGTWARCNMNRRLEFLNSIVTGFWRKWQRDFFPTLLVQQRWHVVKRNLRVDDLVLVQDNNALRGRWRLAQVVEAPAGRDGLVRDVIIRYKNQSSGSKYEGLEDVQVKRSVHRLVVVLPIEEQ